MSFSLQNVSVRFGHTQALADISLEIKAGEQIALVGPSGSGKSTLLRVCNAMQRATVGKVVSLGQNPEGLGPAELRELRAKIGFIHQNLALIPNLRVIQNILLGRAGSRTFWGSFRDMIFPAAADAAAVLEILERVGIAEKLYHRTDHLSGGQQQRAAIARAIFQRPQAILADEPVSSIDPARARDTVEVLTRLCREDGLTLCMSLHNLELAREFFPRLIGLRGGRVLFDKSSAELSGEEFAALYHLSQEEILADD